LNSISACLCATKHLNDDCFKSLVIRCTKTKELELGYGKNKSISANTLEKLDLGYCINIRPHMLLMQLE